MNFEKTSPVDGAAGHHLCPDYKEKHHLHRLRARSSSANASPTSLRSHTLPRQSSSSPSPIPSKPPTPRSPVIPFRVSSLHKGLAKLTMRRRHGSSPSSPSSSSPPARSLATPPPIGSLPETGEPVFGRSLREYASLGHRKGALLRRHSVDPERRRTASTPQRSLDSGPSDAFSYNHLYLLRDSKSNSVFGSGDCDRLDYQELEGDEELVYVKFFKFYRSYDLIPLSAKLIVFDTQLLVKKAFYALVYNGVRAAPLWDSGQREFVAMLTITDFINILRNYYKSPNANKIDELEEQKIEAWRNVLKENSRPLVSITPDDSLFEAIKTLIHNKVHRLPVVDPKTDNVLYILTHKRILKFLFLYYSDLPQPGYLNKTLSELRIGTYDDIAVTTMSALLIDALDLFVERRVSALPVVDEKGRVIDIYAKLDVINLAAEKTYHKLDITIRKALEHRDQYFEGVVKCTINDTLHSVMEKIVKAEVHRIVVVDARDHVVGMVSLSDVLSYLTLRPVGYERKDVTVDALLEESCEEVQAACEGRTEIVETKEDEFSDESDERDETTAV